MKKRLLCPKGHVMEKRQTINGRIAKECPIQCIEYNKCRFNYDVSGCYWCNKCSKHYYVKSKKIWSVS